MKEIIKTLLGNYPMSPGQGDYRTLERNGRRKIKLSKTQEGTYLPLSRGVKPTTM